MVKISPYVIDYLSIFLSEKDYDLFLLWYCNRKKIIRKDLKTTSYFAKNCDCEKTLFVKPYYCKEKVVGRIINWYKSGSERFFWNDFRYLCKEIDFKIRRLDGKLETNIFIDRLEVENSLLKHFLSLKTKKNSYVLSSEGVTLYLKYSKGKCRLYKYKDSKRICFELEWTNKEFLNSVRNLLKSDDLEKLKNVVVIELERKIMELKNSSVTSVLKNKVKGLLKQDPKCISLSVKCAEFDKKIAKEDLKSLSEIPLEIPLELSVKKPVSKNLFDLNKGVFFIFLYSLYKSKKSDVFEVKRMDYYK